MTAAHDDGRPIGALDVAAFLAELVLLAGAAWAGARLADGVVALMLAVLLPVVVAVIWAVILAPRSARRLPHPVRLVVKLALVVVVAVLLAISGLPVWAGLLLAIVGATFVAGDLHEHRAGTHRRDR